MVNREPLTDNIKLTVESLEKLKSPYLSPELSKRLEEHIELLKCHAATDELLKKPDDFLKKTHQLMKELEEDLQKIAVEIAARLGAKVRFFNEKLENFRSFEKRDTGFIQASPNKWMEYALHLLLPEDQRETLIGDLEEEYRSIIYPKFGKRAADIWYAKQVMSSILPILQARLLKLIGWATGGLGLGSAVEWFRKWSGGD